MIRSRLRGKRQRGFTLLEILLVVAIIAILAGIVIIAISPSKNLGDSRNAQRSVDVNVILNGVYQYYVDNNVLPPVGSRSGAVVISTTPTEVCSSVAVACTGLVDLATLTTTGKYMAAIPKDPRCQTSCNANGTGYTIGLLSNNRLVVNSLNPENSKTISVTK